MTAIGKPGEFVRTCDHGVAIQAGAPTPANSPEGGGFRAIPDRFCVEQECWCRRARTRTSSRAARDLGDVEQHPARANGHTLVFFNPYFQVRQPSRYYDPAIAPVVGRPIDVCYEVRRTATARRATTATRPRTTARPPA